MKQFLYDKRFPEYLRRTIDLKNAKCAQPKTYAGVHILKLPDHATFCEDGRKKGLRPEVFLTCLLAADLKVVAFFFGGGGGINLF
jgi:hypothetical protein